MSADPHTSPTALVDACYDLISFEPGSFFGHQAQTPEARHAVAEVAERVLGARPEVEIFLDGRRAEKGSSALAEIAAKQKEEKLAAIRSAARNHPLVIEAAKLFGRAHATLDVRLDSELG